MACHALAFRLTEVFGCTKRRSIKEVKQTAMQHLQHTISAAFTARHNALVLLVEHPVWQAFAADAIADACLAALVTGQALQTLFVGIVAIWAIVKAFVLPGIATGSTGDAVLVRGTVTCGTRRVTIGTSTKRFTYH